MVLLSLIISKSGTKKVLDIHKDCRSEKEYQKLLWHANILSFCSLEQALS